MQDGWRYFFGSRGGSFWDYEPDPETLLAQVSLASARPVIKARVFSSRGLPSPGDAVYSWPAAAVCRLPETSLHKPLGR